MQSDPIRHLPTDKTKVSTEDQKVIDNVFTNYKPSMTKRIQTALKSSLVVAGLYIILNLPAVDSMLKRVAPSAFSSPMATIMAKTVIFVIVYTALIIFLGKYVQ